MNLKGLNNNNNLNGLNNGNTNKYFFLNLNSLNYDSCNKLKQIE